MILQYQVLYRLPAASAFEKASIEAESPDEAEQRVRAMFPGSEKAVVVNVGPGAVPSLDELRRIREKAGLTNPEVCYYLQKAPDTVTKLRRDGFLPSPEKGGHIPPTPLHIVESVNLPGFGLKSWDQWKPREN